MQVRSLALSCLTVFCGLCVFGAIACADEPLSARPAIWTRADTAASPATDGVTATPASFRPYGRFYRGYGAPYYGRSYYGGSYYRQPYYGRSYYSGYSGLAFSFGTNIGGFLPSYYYGLSPSNYGYYQYAYPTYAGSGYGTYPGYGSYYNYSAYRPYSSAYAPYSSGYNSYSSAYRPWYSYSPSYWNYGSHYRYYSRPYSYYYRYGGAPYSYYYNQPYGSGYNQPYGFGYNQPYGLQPYSSYPPEYGYGLNPYWSY